MTPQSNFMILAAVDRTREAELRRLLASMNLSAGIVNPHNELIPFGKFDELHFARMLILDDQTTGDIGLYTKRPEELRADAKSVADIHVEDLPAKPYPLYLAFLGDIDGDANTFLKKLVGQAEQGLRQIFSCCEGFPLEPNRLLKWLKKHRATAIAAYVNWRGRTVRQIHEEAAMHAALTDYLDDPANAARGVPPRELYLKLRQLIHNHVARRQLSLTDEKPTPLGWQIRNLLHLIGWPLLVLLALPLLVTLAPFYLLALRQREKSDPEFCPVVDQFYSENLSRGEDHFVTNQFSAMGTLKPGLVRLLTAKAVLTGVNYAARHIVRQGRLGRIRTIHFARWAFIAGSERMAFFSNYDGSVESYMDDFINKTGFGLNASFSNGIGYPRTNWLVLDGCGDERKYKEFLRRHTLQTQVWYKAYPGLTAIDLERNTRIREGLEKTSMSDQEARAWVALL